MNEFFQFVGELAMTVNLHVPNLHHVGNHYAVRIDIAQMPAEPFLCFRIVGLLGDGVLNS